MRKNLTISLITLTVVFLIGYKAGDELLAPETDIDAERLLPADLSYMSELQGSVIDPPRELVDFSLPSTTGQPFTLSEQGGQILMLYIGYMNCTDVCPASLFDMMRAYQAVGAPATMVKGLFMTLDPERDTLDRMEAYVQGFHDDFIGLRTGDPELLAQVMNSFGVIAERKDLEDSALGYTIDHSATIFIVGPDGRLIEQFPFGVSYEEIAHDLQVLVDYMLSPDSGSVTANLDESSTEASDADREYRIVIPEGTGSQIAMGEDPGIIPLKIELTLGERDILVLENLDYNDYLVGGIWVAPFETVKKQFYEPQTFVGLCTVTVGRDLVEIIVSAP